MYIHILRMCIYYIMCIVTIVLPIVMYELFTKWFEPSPEQRNTNYNNGNCLSCDSIALLLFVHT